MNIWKVMNFVAWALSAGIFLWLFFDFIRVEKELRQQKKQSQQ
jgi:hypothetical protein